MTPSALLLALALAAPVAAPADLRLAAPFADHMVVQAGQPVALWGWASPGAQVTARMDAQGAAATAGRDGRWRLELPAPAPTEDAFAAHTIRLNAGDTTLTVSDVLVGEVWLASGQSNMEWPVRSCDARDELVARGRVDGVRMLTVVRSSVPEPAADVAGAWEVYDADTVDGFSAVATHFALELHAALDVPVGIVHSSWGGSSVEAWFSSEGLASSERGLQLLDAFRGGQAQASADLAVYPLPTLEGVEAQGWAACSLPVDFDDLIPNYDGSIWFRREVVLPEDWGGTATTLHLGAIDDQDDVWLDGVLVGSSRDDWTTPRNYALSDEARATLADGRATLVIRMEDLHGWGGLKGTPEELVLEGPDRRGLSLAEGWVWKRGARVQSAAPNHRLCHLNNGMLAPLVGLPLSGFLWYQGESNAGNPAAYGDLFPQLIQDWRTRWGMGDLPFYWVQLANFEPGGGDWPGLREAQRRTLYRLPRTGMAVTIDVGNPRDIHPRDKATVGRRLATWALFDTYGLDVVPSGPLPDRAVRSAAGVLVGFETFGAGLAARDRAPALRGFELAGPDGVWHAADARVGPGGVTVSSGDVSEPRQVRYAWRNDPAAADCDANLVNGEGTPATPFLLEVEV